MKTPHLLDTQFLFNMHCAFQSLSEVPGLQAEEKKALKEISDTLETIRGEGLLAEAGPALERHYQELRKLGWAGRSDVLRRAVMDGALMTFDGIRSVLGSRAVHGKRGSAEE